jgi:hypothetical protein
MVLMSTLLMSAVLTSMLLMSIVLISTLVMSTVLPVKGQGARGARRGQTGPVTSMLRLAGW